MTIRVESDGVERMFARLAEYTKIKTEIARGYGSSCIDCFGSGWLGDNQTCVCDLGTAIHAIRSVDIVANWVAATGQEYGIPSRYEHVTLDSIANGPQVAHVRKWLAAPREDGTGIYLHGPFGRGKTHLLVAVLHEILKSAATVDRRGTVEEPFRPLARFVTSTDMLQSLRPGSGDTDGNLRRYQNVGLLVVDDIGVERLTDWGAESMFSIISSRYNAMRPTLITSNYTLGQLAKRINEQVGDGMGFRITERLRESCQSIAFTDADTNWRRS